MVKKPEPKTIWQPVTSWPRANKQSQAYRDFDIGQKVCTMNCGPATGDPRDDKERMFLCEDCLSASDTVFQPNEN